MLNLGLGLGLGLGRSNNRPATALWNQDADSYVQPPGDLSVHKACKVCLVTPGSEGSGDVVLNQYDYTHDKDGNAVALDGSQGNVMLRVPRFHYGYSFDDPTHTWKVSMRPFTGSQVHPAFSKGGVDMQYRYIGVYQACGYDVSAGAYVDGDGTNAWLDRANDKLGSIVGKKPVSNFSRAQGRKMAANVGAGWQITDFNLYSMLKLLYVTKYADLDSWSVLGAGNTRWSFWDYHTCIDATGKVLSVTAPGQSTAGGNSSDYCNVLGIENPFGDVWEFVDGWNILDGANYICDDPAHFADDTTSNYSLFGSTNPTSSGYQNTLQPNIGFLPASVGAGWATKVTDYYAYNAGWRGVLVGGAAYNGANAGLFQMEVSSIGYLNIGARLCF